ncbi:MAG: hypothetical protein HDT16_00090 [Oscillibacter sp.]|nr:hypothetical protein [Oscillibacter sp.]
MDRSGKRKLALLLAVSLLLGLLAGCGKKDNGQQLSANVYVPKYMGLNIDADYVRSGCISGDTIYLVGQNYEEMEKTDPETGESYYDSRESYDIYRIDPEGSTAEKLPNYVGPSVPEGKEGYAYVDDIQSGADGTIWVRETTYIWGYSDMKYPDVAVSAIARSTASVEPAEEEIDELDVVDDDIADEAEAADDVDVDIAVDDVAIDPMPVEYEEDQEIVLRRQLDRDGNELACIDLSGLNDTLTDLLDDDTYVNTISFDGEGNIYAVTGEKVYVLDPQLNLLYILEGEDLWYDLTPLSDGTLGMIQWPYDEETETRSCFLRTIDPAKQDWGTAYPLPSNIYNIQAGGGDYLFYYQVNDSIFGFKAGEPDADGNGTGEGERLFSWIEADINSDSIRSFFFMPDGRVAAINQEWVEDGKDGHTVSDLILLTSTPRSEIPEKTTLIYATLYLTYDARGKIIDFNKKSEQYRIEVRDYSEYDTDYSGTASLQKLNTEILAGNVPDILDTTDLPIRTYGGKDILEDLWPFIESDPDLGRDALMTRPLEANEQDGKLYEVFNSFSIRTVVGPTKIVGDRMSWTLADLTAALQNMPEGCAIFGVTDTKEDMLGTVLSLNMDQFVDWSTGECTFDSDNFKALLSFCNSFPAEFNWDNVDWDEWEEEEARLLTGKQMLQANSLYDFDWNLRMFKSIFRDGYTYIGYPKEDGTCGSSFSFRRGVAMTSACKDKEAAWSFIRQTLLPQSEGDDWYYYGNFPINRSDFDKMTDTAIRSQYVTDENGDPVLDENGEPTIQDWGSWWISEDLELTMQPVTQEDIDQVMALYNAVSSIYRYDEKIFNAVKEVAGQYFAGDKPLDETASLIQNRVSLYVNESR